MPIKLVFFYSWVIFEILVDFDIVSLKAASCQADDNTVSVRTSKELELNGLKISDD